MSVINRMLRDLDQRQQQTQQKSAVPAAAMPQQKPWLLWFAGLLFLVSVVIIGWLFWPQSSQEQAASAVETVDAPNTRAVTEPVTETKVNEPVEPEAQLAQVDNPPQQQETAPVVPAEVAATPSESAVSEASVTPQQSEAEVLETEPESQGSMEVEPVALTAEELALAKFQKAQEALKSGERQRAQELLEQVIVLAPDHIAARSELAAYWYGRNQQNTALAILAEGLERQPQQPRWLLLYGRILFNAGAYDELLMAYRDLPLSSAEAEKLVQLRASAANQSRQFDSAADDYQWLAELTQQGHWWLAAAVAHEDAQQPQRAITAYRQALQATSLNSDGRAYANQRLQALGGR